MTFLQIRTAPPKVVSVNDAITLGNTVTSGVQSALPMIITIAYFIVVVAILFRMWKTRKTQMPMMELIGLAIVFGLMRG